MSKSKNKVAIVDLVGRGNGAMDYYDLALQKGFENVGADCHIYSNFNGSAKTYKHFVSERKGAVQKILNYLYGYTVSLFRCRFSGIPVVILHYFQGTIQDLFPYLLAKLLGLKTVVIVHDIVSMAGNDINSIRSFILNKMSDVLVVHNQYSRSQLEEVVNESAKQRIKVIHHGAFTELIDETVDRKTAREKLDLDQDGNYILFFGKIKKSKGLDVLLNAMPLVNDKIKLIIAGNPWKDDFSIYKEIIEKNNLSDNVITNISYISDEDRENYFKACDALILPYREIFQSGVLLMSLSYSLPVVASDLQSNREIIRDGENGMLFRSGDPESLANAINNLFNDTNKLEMIRNNSIRTIEVEYNWDKIAAEYLPLF